jgi:hypothetical protein
MSAAVKRAMPVSEGTIRPSVAIRASPTERSDASIVERGDSVNASPAVASKVTARSAALTDVSAPGTGSTMRAGQPGA